MMKRELPDADLRAVFVQKMQHAMAVIQGNASAMTGVKIENVLWKKALHIVMFVRKIAQRGY